jgi:hypothetical protein
MSFFIDVLLLAPIRFLDRCERDERIPAAAGASTGQVIR